jgi:hypothetical protein
MENPWEEEREREREKCSVLEMEMQKVGDVKRNGTNRGETKRSEENLGAELHVRGDPNRLAGMRLNFLKDWQTVANRRFNTWETGSHYLWLYSPLLNLGCFFSFLILYTVGRPATYTQNSTNRHPCLEWGEPTIPVFERAKTVHALDRAATVTG